MSKKHLLLALLFTLCLASWAWADGKIWGHINYHNCTPDAQDRVCIRPVAGGDAVWTGYVIIQGGPHYSTYPPNLIPPGTYYIHVLLHDGSDCGLGFVQFLNHGDQNDRCDLLVESMGGGITREEPGP
jgi:hypothetical protein